jgi:hypothetical protein
MWSPANRLANTVVFSRCRILHVHARNSSRPLKYDDTAPTCSGNHEWQDPRLEKAIEFVVPCGTGGGGAYVLHPSFPPRVGLLDLPTQPSCRHVWEFSMFAKPNKWKQIIFISYVKKLVQLCYRTYRHDGSVDCGFVSSSPGAPLRCSFSTIFESIIIVLPKTMGYTSSYCRSMVNLLKDQQERWMAENPNKRELTTRIYVR